MENGIEYIVYIDKYGETCKTTKISDVPFGRFLIRMSLIFGFMAGSVLGAFLMYSILVGLK